MKKKTHSLLRPRTLSLVVDNLERKASSKNAIVKKRAGKFLWEKPPWSSLKRSMLYGDFGRASPQPKGGTACDEKPRQTHKEGFADRRLHRKARVTHVNRH